MPSSSEQRKKRIGSITAALFVLFYVLPLVIGSVFAAVEFLRDGEAFAAVLFLLIYGVMGGAVLIGVVLSEMDFRHLLRADVWGFTAVRLLVVPAIVLLVCRLFQVPYIVTAACTLLSGMPAASLTAVLAARYHGDSELGALLVAVSTILSVVTIPLWFMILQ